MNKPHWTESPRLVILIAILIAIVSVTFAVTSWRVNMVSSNAGDASRLGLINAIKKQAFINESWRETYSEANNAEVYAVYLAQVKAMEASKDPAAMSQAANLRQYLLPNLQLLAQPLATDTTYQKSDGTYDLQKRFDALQAADPELANLDPQASFTIAGQYFVEQRWLTVISVVLAISLFWLALAEISSKHLRLTTMVIGTGIYVLGLVGLGIVELIFIILRRGAL